MKISRVNVWGIEENIRSSKLPMATNPDELNSEITKGTLYLGRAESGSGHDCYIKGIIVQFDIKAPQHFWLQFERYHFQDTVSSQSTMHKILELDLDEYTTSRVSKKTIDMLKELISYHKNFDSEEDMSETKNFLIQYYHLSPELLETKKEIYYTIIENLPEGVELTRRISTNYLQLKSMHKQRRNHKMYTWDIFCDWIESLPYFNVLVLDKEIKDEQ